MAGDFSANGRRGENLGQKIQNRVAADVMQCGAEQDRKDSFGQDGFAQAFLQITDGQGAFVEKFLHQCVIAFRDQLNQRFVRSLGFFGKNCGDIFYFSFAIAVWRVGEGFHRD